MKHFPFVWANLWRKPIRTLFTLMSVVFGFSLFGLILGFDADLRHIAESANAERVYISPRFGGELVLAQQHQISQLRYVSNVGVLGAIAGYYQLPRNRVAIFMQGPGMRGVFRDLPLTLRQWGTLDNTWDGVFVSRLFAERYGLKVGSNFPVVSPDVPRADGSDVWLFNVLGVVPDIPMMPVGFAAGNYRYLDQARRVGDRGEVQQFWVLASDAAHTDDVTREIDEWFSSSNHPTRSVAERAILAGMGGGGRDTVIALISLALAGMVMITFLTGNALRHSIRERATELAVLKVLGFANLEIVTVIVAEAALPCLCGCCFGLAIAAGLAAAMPLILPTAVVMPVPRVDLEVVSAGVGAALLIAAVAAAMPVLAITRLDVATALARQ